ncbi:unnamed protein product, partial [Closterium sp. NIES-53]
MYANAINESSFQYSVSSSSQPLEFILDSGATHTVLRDAGMLLPLSTPSTIYGADSSFAIQSRYTSTLPCPLFPSGCKLQEYGLTGDAERSGLMFIPTATMQ